MLVLLGPPGSDARRVSPTYLDSLDIVIDAAAADDVPQPQPEDFDG